MDERYCSGVVGFLGTWTQVLKGPWRNARGQNRNLLAGRGQWGLLENQGWAWYRCAIEKWPSDLAISKTRDDSFFQGKFPKIRYLLAKEETHR